MAKFIVLATIGADSQVLRELSKTPANTEENLGKYLVGLVVGVNDLKAAPYVVVPRFVLLIVCAVVVPLSTCSQV